MHTVYFDALTYTNFHNSLQNTFFILQITFLYYAIKTIELMTRETASFEKIFHRTKFLAFER